jgi:hypothetical protein
LVDAAKIDALLRELRSWPTGELKKTVRELAEEYGLEPHVIQRLARSEGMSLRVGEVVSDDDVDGGAPTAPISTIPWKEEDD